ncbi:hypothetical protein HDU96_000513 [Phlyctochytrium bullatum]|nr:hypothetical protein HDU96_000513 [Phlyctochytrium bullatum]
MPLLQPLASASTAASTGVSAANTTIPRLRRPWKESYLQPRRPVVPPQVSQGSLQSQSTVPAASLPLATANSFTPTVGTIGAPSTLGGTGTGRVHHANGGLYNHGGRTVVPPPREASIGTPAVVPFYPAGDPVSLGHHPATTTQRPSSTTTSHLTGPQYGVPVPASSSIPSFPLLNPEGFVSPLPLSLRVTSRHAQDAQPYLNKVRSPGPKEPPKDIAAMPLSYSSLPPGLYPASKASSSGVQISHSLNRPTAEASIGTSYATPDPRTQFISNRSHVAGTDAASVSQANGASQKGKSVGVPLPRESSAGTTATFPVTSATTPFHQEPVCIDLTDDTATITPLHQTTPQHRAPVPATISIPPVTLPNPDALQLDSPLPRSWRDTPGHGQPFRDKCEYRNLVLCCSPTLSPDYLEARAKAISHSFDPTSSPFALGDTHFLSNALKQPDEVFRLQPVPTSQAALPVSIATTACPPPAYVPSHGVPQNSTHRGSVTSEDASQKKRKVNHKSHAAHADGTGSESPENKKLKSLGSTPDMIQPQSSSHTAAWVQEAPVRAKRKSPEISGSVAASLDKPDQHKVKQRKLGGEATTYAREIRLRQRLKKRLDEVIQRLRQRNSPLLLLFLTINDALGRKPEEVSRDDITKLITPVTELLSMPFMAHESLLDLPLFEIHAALNLQIAEAMAKDDEHDLFSLPF